MGVGEYNTEYKKVVLKQLVKYNVSTKENLLKIVIDCNDKNRLENILKANNYDKRMKEHEELLKLVGDDKEFEELIADDMKLLTELKKAIGEKINALEEKEKQDPSKENKEDKVKQEKEDTEELFEEENEEEMNENEQKREEEERKEEEEEKVNDDWRKEDLIDKAVFGITTERGDIFARIMKSQMRQITADTYAILNTLNSSPVPEVLENLEQNKNVFKAQIGIGVLIQAISGHDRELFMLANMMARTTSTLIRTLDMHLERYHAEQMKERSKDKKSFGTSKGLSGEIQGKEDKDGKEKATSNKKYWELSSEDKADIQRKQSEIGRNFDSNDTRNNQVTRGKTSIQNDVGR